MQQYFLHSYDTLKNNGFVRTQVELCSAIGVGPQWLKTLGHDARRYTRVRESTVTRYRACLRRWERSAPKRVRPILTDLLKRLADAEQVEAIMRSGR